MKDKNDFDVFLFWIPIHKKAWVADAKKNQTNNNISDKK
jgi:hypothetical protein